MIIIKALFIFINIMSGSINIENKEVSNTEESTLANKNPMNSSSLPSSPSKKTNNNDKEKLNNEENINPSPSKQESTTPVEKKKTPYSNFKVIKANKDISKCSKTNLPMIDLRDKVTNQVDHRYHGLITEIKGHYEPLVAHVMGKGSFGEVFKGVNLQTNRLVAIKKLKIFDTDEIFPITAQREIMILKKMEHVNVVTLNDVIFDNFDKTNLKEDEKNNKSLINNSNNNNNNNSKADLFMTEAEKNNLKNNGSNTGENKKLPHRFFYMVLPYMVSDLAGVIHNPHFTITIPQIKNMMHQILQGLDYVHKMKYFHRDIKTANILIDQYGVLKIADFGLSRIYYGCPPNLKYPGGAGAGMKFTPLVVTRWYRAPELVMFDRFYTTAIDIWGTGCILGEFFIKRPILQGKTDIDQGHLIFQLMGKPDSSKWPTLKYLKQYDAHYSNKTYKGEYREVFGRFLDEAGLDLFAKMLCLNPYERITASAALKHDWFKKEPLPVKTLKFERIMESHESDIDKFDKLKKEMDMQKNSAMNYINHMHNDVTPDLQLSSQRISNTSSTKISNQADTFNKTSNPSGSRFNNSAYTNKHTDQKPNIISRNNNNNRWNDSRNNDDLRYNNSHRKDEQHRFDRPRAGSFTKGDNRFEGSKESFSRFDDNSYNNNNNNNNKRRTEEPKFENRYQRDRKRFEHKKPSNFSKEDPLAAMNTNTDATFKNKHLNEATSYQNKKREHPYGTLKDEEENNFVKKRKQQYELGASNDDTIKQNYSSSSITRKSKTEAKGSIKGKIDDMYD